MDRRTFLRYTGISLSLIFFPEERAAARGLSQGWETSATAAGRRASSLLPDTGSDRDDRAIKDRAIRDRLIKGRLFDHWFKEDVVLTSGDRERLSASLARLKRLQRLVGYGNFCLLGFDEAISTAKSYVRVGEFTKAEIEFLEKIFYNPARDYGFMGEKPIGEITGEVRQKDVTKVTGTGNYLYRGKPMEIYGDICRRVGKNVVLTSGIRGVMKQFLLFLDKACDHGGNLSLASRSLAPPGYSFHGVGDFDVGEQGFGVDNFTEKFTETQVYSRLTDLGYIKFRYAEDNGLGVRFEPWHVEVD